MISSFRIFSSLALASQAARAAILSSCQSSSPSSSAISKLQSFQYLLRGTICPFEFTSLRHFASRPSSDLLIVHPKSLPEHQLEEAQRLAESVPMPCGGGRQGAGFPTVPATYFGSGLVSSIWRKALHHEAKRVYVNAALSGVQQRNLEAAWGVPVLDRVGLIIEIFGQRARTREARLQVELAALEFKASRLVRVWDPGTGKRRGFGLNAETEVVSARERGRSGSGSGGLGAGGGGGESEIELQRRRVAQRRKMLKARLQEVCRTRALQRVSRKRAGKPVVAVVGYTNAGKSSLVNALAKADVQVEDRLFATLDPTLRRMLLPSGREAILSDTVGFISDLPHQLVDAFRATLEEVCEADLLLHVLDASSPHVLEQRRAVLQVLRELGFSEERLESGVIEVWNKADLLAGEGGGGAEGGAAPEGALQQQGGKGRVLEGGEGDAQEMAGAPPAAASPPPQLPHLGFIRQLLDAHAAAEAAAKAGGLPGRKRRRGGGGGGAGTADQPPQPPLNAWEAAEVIREVVLSGAGEDEAPLLPACVLTSVTEGAGLPQLQLLAEKKLAVRMDTAEFRRLAASHGRKLLTQPVVRGFSAAGEDGDVGSGKGRGRPERSRAKRGRTTQQLRHWSDDVLAQRL